MKASKDRLIKQMKSGEPILPSRLSKKTSVQQSKFSKTPLKVLKSLEKEIFLNYDLFEDTEGDLSLKDLRSHDEPIETE